MLGFIPALYATITFVMYGLGMVQLFIFSPHLAFSVDVGLWLCFLLFGFTCLFAYFSLWRARSVETVMERLNISLVGIVVITAIFSLIAWSLLPLLCGVVNALASYVVKEKMLRFLFS